MSRALELNLSFTPENQAPETTTVIMPIGGLATRAREVTQDLIPKHLILLGDGRPVLDHVLRGLQNVGFKNFVFCVGQHKDKIIDFVNSGKWNIADANYHFSEEEELLGPDGAVRHAINNLDIQGRAMIVPGDIMLPWRGLARMVDFHSRNGAGMTFGVTSHITERTTDIGKMVVEEDTGRLIWCYPREEQNPTGDRLRSRGLTSAASMVVSVSQYKEVIDAYTSECAAHGTKKISFRDEIAPWLIRNGEHQVYAFDVRGEVLDLGTPSTIAYGIEHWQNYA